MPMPRAASFSANSRQYRSWDLGSISHATDALWRRHRKIDDLLTLQLAHQTHDFVLAQYAVAKLQPEHAALAAMDDRGLIIFEQRVDVGHARVRRKPHQCTRRHC